MRRRARVLARVGLSSGARVAGVVVALGLCAIPRAASAQEPVDAGRTWASCTEHLPSGAHRPNLVESFPERGTSGYASRLEITVAHGKGETVLPEGFKVQGGSDAARALEASGFYIPELDGGAVPTLSTEQTNDGAKTVLSIPFLTLPKEPGRHAMVLPPVPIAIARASGEFITVCTAPHPIVVEDPIANESDPKVKPNPEPRRQREQWVLARQVTYGALAGIAAGLLAAWLIRRWMKRPKPEVIVPPKLPWVLALEELEAVRSSDLLAQGRSGEYFDRVSDCVRKYLGSRYGFDGLESTTDEILAALAQVRPKVSELARIRVFLTDCDLVKFARMMPAEQDCLDALVRGEHIVVTTTPKSPKESPESLELSA